MFQARQLTDTYVAGQKPFDVIDTIQSMTQNYHLFNFYELEWMNFLIGNLYKFISILFAIFA